MSGCGLVCAVDPTAAGPPRPLAELFAAARADRRPLLLPGVYDAFSARLAAAAGFEAIYLTGAGLANSRLGVPDIGLVSADQLVDHVGSLAEAVGIPLVVDADTGFGNAINVTRVVRRLERAGAAAIQLEDQVFPKKCGHFAGKAVIGVQEMEGKLRAALDARSSDDTLIIARTDARAVEGFEAALERAARYRAVGADMIFVEAPTSKPTRCGPSATGSTPRTLPTWSRGARRRSLPLEELGEMGFSAVLYANAALRCAQRALTQAFAQLREAGTSANLLDAMATWDERQEAVGKPYYDELEARYAS